MGAAASQPCRPISPSVSRVATSRATPHALQLTERPGATDVAANFRCAPDASRTSTLPTGAPTEQRLTESLTCSRRVTYRADMLRLPLRGTHVAVSIAVVMGAVYGASGAAKRAAASTPAAAPVSEPREHGAVAQTARPDADATPAAATDATKTADSCRTAVAGLGSGDVSALQHLSADQREGIVQGPIALKAFQCLTIADDNSRYCDALSE